jgi:exodeoxyribonuclease VII small subunit
MSAHDGAGRDASDGGGGSTPADGPTEAASREEVATLPFDRALAELGAIVARLETGGLPLEEAIELYERGVVLHERCATLLGAAELRVRRLADAASGPPRALDLRPDDALDEEA